MGVLSIGAESSVLTLLVCRGGGGGHFGMFDGFRPGFLGVAGNECRLWLWEVSSCLSADLDIAFYSVSHRRRQLLQSFLDDLDR